MGWSISYCPSLQYGKKWFVDGEKVCPDERDFRVIVPLMQL